MNKPIQQQRKIDDMATITTYQKEAKIPKYGSMRIEVGTNASGPLRQPATTYLRISNDYMTTQADTQPPQKLVSNIAIVLHEAGEALLLAKALYYAASMLNAQLDGREVR